MGAQGTAIVNFGAFPGTTDTSVTVTGQGSILSGSLVEAWVMPTATADHNVGEHIVDPPSVIAGDISAGVGFTIYASTKNNIRHYGQYTIAWVWN